MLLPATAPVIGAILAENCDLVNEQTSWTGKLRKLAKMSSGLQGISAQVREPRMALNLIATEQPRARGVK